MVKIANVSQYINEIKSYADGMVYRGQSNPSWKLQPKIARDEFNSLGDLRLFEKDNLIKFKKISGLFSEKDSLISVMTIGQHYGLATRILDWTLNPLIALWFALDSNEEQKDCVVYAYPFLKKELELQENDIDDILIVDSFFTGNKKPPLFYRPFNMDKRISNQYSVFSLCYGMHEYNYQLDEEGGDYIPNLEDIPDFQQRLKTISITIQDKPQLLEELNFLGINKYFVYNDFSSLCEMINIEKI